MRPLTETQHDVLINFCCAGFGVNEWVRPMDIGGGDGTHHSAVLSQLEHRGLVESKPRMGVLAARGSKLYRLTPAGLIAGGQLASAPAEPLTD